MDFKKSIITHIDLTYYVLALFTITLSTFALNQDILPDISRLPLKTFVFIVLTLINFIFFIFLTTAEKSGEKA